MGIRHFVLIGMALVAMTAGSAVAQQTLADMVAEGGYDWLIGKWAATTDDGDVVRFEHKWALDRQVIQVDFQTPDFTYKGFVAYVPSREEIVQKGVDNQGGIYKGLWSQEYEAAALRIEHTEADGTVQKMDLVYRPGQDKAVEVAIYGVESDGWRASKPQITLQFKPDKSKEAISASSGGYSYYQSLGDLTRQMGYAWIEGAWTATRSDGLAIDLKYDWILNKYAVAVDVQMGGFKYQGFIAYVPSREEVIQIGADNMGGVWEGAWSESYDGIAHRTECTRADGTKVRVEHVYLPGDKDSFTLKEYPVEADGYRASTPRGTQVFKRKPKTSN